VNAGIPELMHEERPVREPRFTMLWSAMAALACVAAGVWAFGLGERVPLLSGVDFGIHEFGHLLTAWAPDLVHSAAGSTLQVLTPLGLAAYFGLVRRQAPAAAVLLAWAGTSAQNASVYIADAPYEMLPLWGGGLHDWAHILASLQHIEWAAPLSATVWGFGLLMVVVGFALALVAPGAAVLDARKAAAERERIARLPRRDPRTTPRVGPLESYGDPLEPGVVPSGGDAGVPGPQSVEPGPSSPW
jgi:hypothetical protein